MTVYSVKNIKTFTGREGKGFNATLYRDGIKIALVIDSANGGELSFQWDNHADRKEERLLEAYCKSLPQIEFWKDSGLFDQTPELYISALVENFGFRKKMKNQLQKRTIFLTDGHLREYNRPYTQDIQEQIKKTFPDAVILNAFKSEDEAWTLFEKYGVAR